MTPRLVLHVGAMKTGTTYLQNVLHANADLLGSQGWVVPPQREVVRASREVLAVEGAAVGARGRPGREAVAGAEGAPRWHALLDDVRRQLTDSGGPGAVVSMEFLSFARPEGVAAILESTAGLDLHVVLTVRDAVRALPSQWQSLTRNGFRSSWPEFAEGVRTVMQGQPHPAARPFLRTQRIPRMVQAWAGAVPPERFTVITVPPAEAGLPRDVSWRRFCSVVGVDPDATTTEADFDNPQLGYGSCELLVRVNTELGLRPPGDYRKVMRTLTHEDLLPLRDRQTRPRLDEATAALAARLNTRTLAAVAEHATLLGDPAELPAEVDPVVALDPGDRPADVPEAEVRVAASALLAGARALCARRGLDLPDGLRGDLPTEPADAVRLVAAVIDRAIDGAGAGAREDSHGA